MSIIEKLTEGVINLATGAHTIQLAFYDGITQKGKSVGDIRADLGRECADVLAHLMLFARNNEINLEKELREKWFVYLDDHDK